MAWRSKILPIKVLDSKGLGPDAAVSKGIIYAVENKAKIINLSSGTQYQSRLLDEAVRFAERRGVLVVAAAGNTGDKGNEVIYPAAYPTVMAVGATDEKDAAPPFSQRQPYVSDRGAGRGRARARPGAMPATARTSCTPAPRRRRPTSRGWRRCCSRSSPICRPPSSARSSPARPTR